MDTWESTKKAILVDSCYSGYWSFDFRASPYLAISSADELHTCYLWDYGSDGIIDEGVFSFYFFERVHAGYTDFSCYWYAKGFVDPYQDGTHYQHPIYNDYSSYTWFS